MRSHDLGGAEGFGPLDAVESDHAFSADWEARLFALNVALRRRGTYTSDEFRDAIERMDPATYHDSSYYERWLAAITLLLVDRGLVAAEALEDTANG